MMCIDNDLDEAVDLLYGSTEEKLQGVNRVISLCRNDIDAMNSAVTNHQLMSALARLFGEGGSHEICFVIGKLFLALVSIEDFQDVLSTYRVGALTSGVIEIEVRRSQHRGNTVAAPTDPNKFSTKEEAVIMIGCDILSHIADDFGALRKMIKKDIASTLAHCLSMNAIPALHSVLKLLLKVCIFEEAADELSGDESKAIEKLVRLLHVPTLNDEVASILFNLSFHEDCLSVMSSTDIYSSVTKLLGKKPIHHSIYKLAYHLSCNEGNRNQLVGAGITSKLEDILKNSLSRFQIHEGLAGLLVNMSLHPICAEDMMKSGIVAIIMGVIKESKDDCTKHAIVKVLRNLSQWSRDLQNKLQQAATLGDGSPLDGHVKRVECYFITTKSENDFNSPHGRIMYWEHRFWDAHVEHTLENALGCDDHTLLVEWIGILSNITKDDMPPGLTWHDLIIDNSSKILQLCHNTLDSPHTDLKTGVIIWLGELCSSQESSSWIANSNIIEAMHEELQNTSYVSEELKLQILWSYQQFMMYEETRFQVVGGHGELCIFVCDILRFILCSHRKSFSRSH